MLTLAEAPYTDPGMEPHFRHRALFTGGNVRTAVNEGRADFVPIHLHEVAGLLAPPRQTHGKSVQGRHQRESQRLEPASSVSPSFAVWVENTSNGTSARQ